MILSKRIVVFLTLAYAISYVSGQVSFGTQASFVHYSHSGLGGVGLQLVIGSEINEWNSLQFRGGVHYAIGHRGFRREPGAIYVVYDGKSKPGFPFAQPFSEEYSLFTGGLNSAQTVDLGGSITYLLKIIKTPDIAFHLGTGIGLSWIEDSWIPFTFKGHFDPVLGIEEEVILVSPFSDRFFTCGPHLEAHLSYQVSEKLHLGFTAGSSWLLKTGFRIESGLMLLVRL